MSTVCLLGVYLMVCQHIICYLKHECVHVSGYVCWILLAAHRASLVLDFKSPGLHCLVISSLQSRCWRSPSVFHSVATGTTGPGTEISTLHLLEQEKKHSLTHTYTHTSVSSLSCRCLSTPARLTHRPIYSNEFVLKYLAARPPGHRFRAT